MWFMHFILQTRQQTAQWGTAFGSMVQSGDVVALIGDLGSGKTTLAKAIARGLAVTDPVTSPTFSLIQEYAGQIPMYHFDPYRLDRPEEIAELGLDEYLQREGVVVVEWANLIEQLLPSDRFEIRIDILNTSSNRDESESQPRSLSIEGLGEHALDVVFRLGNLADVADLLTGNEVIHAR